MIVCDTHVWYWWWIGSSRVSLRARAAIADADLLGIPAIGLWEFAMLAFKGRLSVTDPEQFVSGVLNTPRVQLLPLVPEIALRAAALPPPLHNDPADRLIAATALHHGAPLVTADRELQAYAPLATVWYLRPQVQPPFLPRHLLDDVPVAATIPPNGAASGGGRG